MKQTMIFGFLDTFSRNVNIFFQYTAHLRTLEPKLDPKCESEQHKQQLMEGWLFMDMHSEVKRMTRLTKETHIAAFTAGLKLGF